MTVVEQLKKHYATPGNAPLSTTELVARYGTKWGKDSQQAVEFTLRFVICRDGIIRIRGTIAEIRATQTAQ
jgi:hypothetical protein